MSNSFFSDACRVISVLTIGCMGVCVGAFAGTGAGSFPVVTYVGSYHPSYGIGEVDNHLRVESGTDRDTEDGYNVYDYIDFEWETIAGNATMDGYTSGVIPPVGPFQGWFEWRMPTSVSGASEYQRIDLKFWNADDYPFKDFQEQFEPGYQGPKTYIFRRDVQNMCYFPVGLYVLSPISMEPYLFRYAGNPNGVFDIYPYQMKAPNPSSGTRPVSSLHQDISLEENLMVLENNLVSISLPRNHPGNFLMTDGGRASDELAITFQGAIESDDISYALPDPVRQAILAGEHPVYVCQQFLTIGGRYVQTHRHEYYIDPFSLELVTMQVDIGGEIITVFWYGYTRLITNLVVL